MQRVSYDAFHDPHLAAYFTKPGVEKQVKRSAIAARLDKRPVHFREFAAYLTKPVSPLCCDIASSACSCAEQEQNSCQFCQLKNVRAKLMRRYESLGEEHTPSPLGNLLQQIRKKSDPSQGGDLGTLRSSSACGLRPTPPVSRSGSRSSSRQSRPSSRPSSASGYRPPSRYSETPTKTHRVVRKNQQEQELSVDNVASMRSEKHHCKKVKFDEVRYEAAEAAAAATNAAPAATNTVSRGPFRGRRAMNDHCVMSSGAHSARSETFLDPCALSTGDTPSPHDDDGAMRTMVSSIVQKESTSNATGEAVNNSSLPQTFVLVKFTMRQYRGAATVQRWFRGTSARVRVKRMKWAAVRIQRAFRRFRSTCTTAVAVWMLQKDRNGHWHPRSTFDQVSQYPTSARVQFTGRGATNSDDAVPSSVRGLHLPSVPESLRSTIDFHRGTIASLGHVMSLLVSEPQERMNIVYDEVSAAREIGILETSNAELVRRRAIIMAEMQGWTTIELCRSSSMRILQAKRKLLLHQDVGRQQLSKNEADSAATILSLHQAHKDVLVEPHARMKLIAQWSASRTSATAAFLGRIEAVLRCALELDATAAVEAALRHQCNVECILDSLLVLRAQEGTLRSRLLLFESFAAASLQDRLEVIQEIRRTVSTVIDQAVADFEGGST